MSKAKNPTIGTIPCTCCGVTADIRKVAKSGTLYVHCNTCGTDVRKGAAFQDHVAAKGDFFPGPDRSDPAPLPDDDTEPRELNPARQTEQPVKSVDGDNAGSWLPGVLIS